MIAYQCGEFGVTVLTQQSSKQFSSFQSGMLGSIFGKNKEQKRRSKQEQEEKKTLGKLRFIFFINLTIHLQTMFLVQRTVRKKSLKKRNKNFNRKKEKEKGKSFK